MRGPSPALPGWRLARRRCLPDGGVELRDEQEGDGVGAHAQHLAERREQRRGALERLAHARRDTRRRRAQLRVKCAACGCSVGVGRGEVAHDLAQPIGQPAHLRLESALAEALRHARRAVQEVRLWKCLVDRREGGEQLRHAREQLERADALLAEMPARYFHHPARHLGHRLE